MHATNIQNFLSGCGDSAPALIRAYLGLVAIELALKAHVRLTNHDVCHALTQYKNKYCVGGLAFKKSSLAAIGTRLRNDIQAIRVNDRDGQPRFAPGESYPFIRYVRLSDDGWDAPSCPLADVERLARTVQQARALLRKEFKLPV